MKTHVHYCKAGSQINQFESSLSYQCRTRAALDSTYTSRSHVGRSDVAEISLFKLIILRNHSIDQSINQSINQCNVTEVVTSKMYNNIKWNKEFIEPRKRPCVGTTKQVCFTSNMKSIKHFAVHVHVWAKGGSDNQSQTDSMRRHQQYWLNKDRVKPINLPHEWAVKVMHVAISTSTLFVSTAVLLDSLRDTLSCGTGGMRPRLAQWCDWSDVDGRSTEDQRNENYDLDDSSQGIQGEDEYSAMVSAPLCCTPYNIQVLEEFKAQYRSTNSIVRLYPAAVDITALGPFCDWWRECVDGANRQGAAQVAVRWLVSIINKVTRRAFQSARWGH